MSLFNRRKSENQASKGTGKEQASQEQVPQERVSRGQEEGREPLKQPEAAQGGTGADVSFIKERVKARPINRRNLLRRTIVTVVLAALFGVIACVTFLVLEPLFSNWLYPEEEPEFVQLQEENVDEEMLPEDMLLEESEVPGVGTQEGMTDDVLNLAEADEGTDDGESDGSLPTGEEVSETAAEDGDEALVPAGEEPAPAEEEEPAPDMSETESSEPAEEQGEEAGTLAEQGDAGEDGDAQEEQETSLQEEAEPTIVIENVELDVSSYRTLYKELYSLVQEVSTSIVTVTGVTSETDWFDNSYENEGMTSGLIVADNGKALLILTDNGSVLQAETLQVTFYDGTEVDAQLKQEDPNVGLAVVSVSLEDIPETTLETVTTARLGYSNNTSGLLATPVIALGRPMGTESSVGYGMLTSLDSVLNLTDGNYRLLMTDIYGSANASGVIFNLSGQVLGIISQSHAASDAPNLITAIGISDIKSNIEKMSNGQPVAVLGITGTDVPALIQESQGVPAGAYVTGIELDSPAMTAGIQSGDVITRIGTEEITSFSAYKSALMALSPDTVITLTVMRLVQEEYQEMTVDVTLGTLE